MSDRAVYANANALRLPLADKSVHMIATSPPYWGLRSYDTGTNKAAELGMEPLHDCLAWARGDEPCGGCFVCNLRTWAREMHRVLRDDGVMFLNLGDSYAANRGSGASGIGAKQATNSGANLGSLRVPSGLKEKDLVGIPWRVALALQADGFYLRSDIIWAKPNPMPESVTDRPTKAHEYVFLLTKSARYFWDAEAVREESPDYVTERIEREAANGMNGRVHSKLAPHVGLSPSTLMDKQVGARTPGRNIRTVWTIATAPYSGAHFATWPPALVERMIRAGTSERGVCSECGKPWERVVEKELTGVDERRPANGMPGRTGNGLTRMRAGDPQTTTTGWRPTCSHTADPVPAVVLDPFAGSGTTLMVARQLGRIGLGFDLSETYLRENCAVRLGHDKLAAWGKGIKDAADYGDLFKVTQ